MSNRSIKITKEVTCRVFGVPEEFIDANTRLREVVKVRQAAHYVAWKAGTGSLQAIALIIGKKNHATAINSIRTVDNLITPNRMGFVADPEYREKVDEIYQEVSKRCKKNLGIAVAMAKSRRRGYHIRIAFRFKRK